MKKIEIKIINWGGEDYYIEIKKDNETMELIIGSLHLNPILDALAKITKEKPLEVGE